MRAQTEHPRGDPARSAGSRSTDRRNLDPWTEPDSNSAYRPPPHRGASRVVVLGDRSLPATHPQKRFGRLYGLDKAAKSERVWFDCLTEEAR